MQVTVTAVGLLSSGALIAKIHVKNFYFFFSNQSGVNFSPEVRRNITGRLLGEDAVCYPQVQFLASPSPK